MIQLQMYIYVHKSYVSEALDMLLEDFEQRYYRAAYITMGAGALLVDLAAVIHAVKKGRLRRFSESRPIFPYPLSRLMKSACSAPGIYVFGVSAAFFCFTSLSVKRR